MNSDYQATFNCDVLTTLKHKHEKDIVFNGIEKKVVNEQHHTITEIGNFIFKCSGYKLNEFFRSLSKTGYRVIGINVGEIKFE